MACKPRPAKTASLSSADLELIGRTVSTSVNDAVPLAMRAEFLRIGLATEREQDAIEVQRDFAFVRTLREAAKNARSLFWQRVFNVLLAGLGLVMAAGFGAIVTRSADKPPPEIVAPKG